jgi:HAD superfamily hydrolase (TIGR01509 family)
MLAAVIFDLDGVLADTHPVHRRVWRQFLLGKGRNVSEEDLDFVEGGYKLKEILTHFLGSLSPAEISSYGEQKQQLFYEAASEVRTAPGVVDLLRELQSAGIPRAVATSASRLRAHTLLEDLDLAPYFSFVVTGDDVVQGKPDPSIFSLAAQLLEVSPRHCLVAEDSRAGVHAAKSAGMRCLAIAQGQRAIRLLDEGADYVVPSLAGLSINHLHDLFRTSQDPANFPTASS